MEAVGVPIDVENLVRLRKGWWTIQDGLIERVDQHYGVFDGRKFNPRRWATWLNRNRIPWPRLSPGRLDLNHDAFRDMAKAFPEVRPMKELLASLSLMRLFELAVGTDGRNRVPLRPFASKTGRNQPSTSKFIFGPATWVRGLIRPTEGMALAYVDYEQQEFGIAAALSGDRNMKEAYRSGDPYLTFAKQTGAVPTDATKESHRDLRDRFKQCALGVQYGMGAKSLGVRLGISSARAKELLLLHKRTYRTYWQWSDEVERRAFAEGGLESAFGWRLNVNRGANPRSLRNFPLQANGAEMLRLACCFLTEAGVRVCAPIHDAILVEAPVEQIEAVVVSCAEAMQRASEAVLPGFRLRTDAKIVRFPERYEDPRGKVMWDIVFELLDRGILNHVHKKGAMSMQRCNI
jgi:DNA polymerase-1